MSNRRWTALCAELSAAYRLPHRSASTAAPRLRPLQLLRARRWRPLQLASCCTAPRYAIASASAAARSPLQLLLPDCVRFDCSPITSACSPSCSQPWPHSSPQSSRFSKLKNEGSASLLVPPHEHPTSVTQRHRHTLKS